VVSTKSSDKLWAIIPARGGSVGIPKKNIRGLGGRPLITWAIESLIESNLFERIFVTTDSEEIAQVALNHHVEVVMRTSEEESNSFTMPDIPVRSLLAGMPAEELPSHCFMVQCTAPFVSSVRYKQAAALIKKHPESTVFSATESHSFLWRHESTDAPVEPLGHPFRERLGRQYLSYKQYQESGGFYGFPTLKFISSSHRFIHQAYPVVVSGLEALDIDTYEDWELAEYYIQKKRINKSGQ